MTPDPRLICGPDAPTLWRMLSASERAILAGISGSTEAPDWHANRRRASEARERAAPIIERARREEEHRRWRQRMKQRRRQARRMEAA